MSKKIQHVKCQDVDPNFVWPRMWTTTRTESVIQIFSTYRLQSASLLILYQRNMFMERRKNSQYLSYRSMVRVTGYMGVCIDSMTPAPFLLLGNFMKESSSRTCRPIKSSLPPSTTKQIVSFDDSFCACIAFFRMLTTHYCPVIQSFNLQKDLKRN